MPIKSAGTYMQISDLCESCSKQNFCGNGIINHYCTGYTPITYQYHTDIKIPPFDADVELDKLDNESMTEQEYIQTCNTEQLAETIAQYFYGWTNNSTPYDIILHSVVEWLKQPHTTTKE